MTQKLIASAGAFLICCFLLPACTNDKLPEPTVLAVCDTLQATYVINVKDIIDQNCAYSGCHVDATIGNYLSYEGMLSRLENGSVRNRVINLRSDPNEGMPPDYAPADRAKDLTEAELEIIQCWLDAGFPKE